MHLVISKLYSVNQLRTLELFNCGIYVWLLQASTDNVFRVHFPSQLKVVLDNKEYFILYLGIGPNSEKSTSNFRARLLGNHVLGNIYCSTFRFSVAALLGLQFFKTKKLTKKSTWKTVYLLSAEGEEEVTNFLNQNCRVSIFEIPRPWDMERELIQYYQPPLNLDDNSKGWFYREMKHYRSIARLNATNLMDC